MVLRAAPKLLPGCSKLHPAAPLYVQVAGAKSKKVSQNMKVAKDCIHNKVIINTWISRVFISFVFLRSKWTALGSNRKCFGANVGGLGAKVEVTKTRLGDLAAKVEILEVQLKKL